MRRIKGLVIFTGFIIIVVMIALYTVRKTHPVLVHAFSDCACTDYSDDVTGLTLFNPFRDLSPEVAADAFFNDLRNGRCQQSVYKSAQFKSIDCAYNRPGFAWQLRNRKDNADGTVILFYNFDAYEGDIHTDFSSEGAVVVAKEDGAWKVFSLGIIW